MSIILNLIYFLLYFSLLQLRFNFNLNKVIVYIKKEINLYL